MVDKLGEALPSPDAADDWSHLKTTVYNAAVYVIGHKRSHHKDWFDDNDGEATALLDDMHAKHLAWIQEKNDTGKKQAYTQARSIAQKKLRYMK